MASIFDNADLTAEDFLREYWQKQPLMLRQAFPDFDPELDADDIAGLACEELAESRLVFGRYPGGGWTVRYGPFDERDFERLPERDWTLLVQDVEKHYPPLQGLFDVFDFLPRWRIDDLMVSVAGPGGSVGPHADQYDVFLLQAAGRRRWQVAGRFEPELEPDCELNVLRRFEAERDWLLEPGDLLYLPPGIAHFGVADVDAGTTCMTWSIGMRAPSAADLLLAYGEWLAAEGDEGGRYRDPPLPGAPDPGQVAEDAVRRLDELAGGAFDDPERWRTFLGVFLSTWRLAHEPAPPPHEVTAAELARRLGRGARLRHNPWTRLLWLPANGTARLFAAGSEFECSPATARAICSPTGLEVLGSRPPEDVLALLCQLVNRGHLLIETV